MHAKFLVQCCLLSTVACSVYGQGALLVSRTGGQVGVSDQTLLGTFVTVEARVLFTEEFSDFGLVLSEWDFAREDKSLYVGPDGVEAYFLGVSGIQRITTNRPLSLDVWHHVAWELASGVERLFIDGANTNSKCNNVEVDICERSLGRSNVESYQRFVVRTEAQRWQVILRSGSGKSYIE